MQRFTLGSDAHHDGGEDRRERAWEWSVWLNDSAPRVEKSVDRVTYTLEAGLPAPVRVARDATCRYRITGRTWGSFKVSARITYADGSSDPPLECDVEVRYPDRPDESGPRITQPSSNGASDRLALGAQFAAAGAYEIARSWVGQARRADDAGAGRHPAELRQKLALWTYKDPSLPRDRRLLDAFEALGGERALATSDDPEALGLAGAIWKRRWEVDGNPCHLQRAYAYYRRGHDIDTTRAANHPEYRFGYLGVNAIFVLELLSYEETVEACAAGGSSPIAAAERLREADALRRNLVERLPRDIAWLEAERPDQVETLYWAIASLAEVHLGLGELAQVGIHLRRALGLTVPEWHHESTAAQMLALVRCSGRSEDARAAARAAIVEHFGPLPDSGTKIGLALSGGGFRASMFHLGVLARLAELGVLSSVEVFSCVSGGSIVGAHYYLGLRRLLQTVPDGRLGREHYIALVHDTIASFVKGTQRNIRMRVIGNLWWNLKMLLMPSRFSRTERLGMLYERELFSRVDRGDGSHDPKHFWLDELLITPCVDDGAGGVRPDDQFSPKLHNWRRKAKVPVLLLNAANLNTGHSWQFAATFMGESPFGLESDVDGNDRLRRMYYEEAPPRYRRFSLGKAVAASSCVPALFDPLPLSDLYPGRVVRLVDGGVHDNQGVAGLLEQDCNAIIVSDASGQMSSELDPGPGTLSVLSRSGSILQARIRGTQVTDLEARHRNSLLKAFAFLHVREGLEPNAVAWIGHVDPVTGVKTRVAANSSRPENRGWLPESTDHRLSKGVQDALSRIRTDLDTFNHFESYALMTSGYRIAERKFDTDLLEKLGARTIGHDAREAWPFLTVEKDLIGDSAKLTKRLLSAAAYIGFKPYRVSAWPGIVTALVLGAALSAGFYFKRGAIAAALDRPLFAAPTLGALLRYAALMAVFAIAGAFIGRRVIKFIRFRELVVETMVRVAVAFVGWAIAWIYILLLDPIYRRAGDVKGEPRAADPLSFPARTDALPLNPAPAPPPSCKSPSVGRIAGSHATEVDAEFRASDEGGGKRACPYSTCPKRQW